jgi:hypothetical protein
MGYAVNVTVEPAQTGSKLGEIVILTARLVLTFMTIEFEVAGLFEIHTVKEEVSSQHTISLFNGV